MRILFSSLPAFGHLLPLLSVAQTAQKAGHEVAFLTHIGHTDLLKPFPVLPAGPDYADLMADAGRRTGRDPSKAVDDPPMAAEIFIHSRLALGFEEALSAARAYAPDLIVAESADFIGPLVAATLKVPWVRFAVFLNGVMTGGILEALIQAEAASFAARELPPHPRLAFLDSFPDPLQLEGWTPDADRLPIRPRPHAQEGVAWTRPTFAGREDLPLVLLTLGTIVGSVIENPSALILKTLGDEVNVIVTMGSQEKADALEVDRSRVQPIGFVPLDQLLEGVDLVISAGGVGTLLATLSRGLPVVVLPFIFDQFANAERVAASGFGLVVTRPEEVGAAVKTVLRDPNYRSAAAKVGQQIAQMNSQQQVLELLSERIGQKVG